MLLARVVHEMKFIHGTFEAAVVKQRFPLLDLSRKFPPEVRFSSVPRIRHNNQTPSSILHVSAFSSRQRVVWCFLHTRIAIFAGGRWDLSRTGLFDDVASSMSSQSGKLVHMLHRAGRRHMGKAKRGDWAEASMSSDTQVSVSAAFLP